MQQVSDFVSALSPAVPPLRCQFALSTSHRYHPPSTSSLASIPATIATANCPWQTGRPKQPWIEATRLLFTLFASVLLPRSAVHAEKRVAFVIGNAGDKKAVRLQNPKNDATPLNSVHLAYRPSHTRHKFVNHR
jgi:hypothetical protein